LIIYNLNERGIIFRTILIQTNGLKNGLQAKKC